ncbi:unnamed protein product, partial [Prorocentrum cordatum]
NAAEELWRRCRDAGDIYEGVFKGWYRRRDEQFVESTDALESGFVDALSGEPLVRAEQECFLFRLPKHRDAVVELVESPG